MEKEFDVAVIETKDFEYFMVACSKNADVQSKKNVLMQVLPPEAKYQSIEVYRTSDLAYAYSVIRHSSEGNQLIFRTKIDFANAPEVFVINGAVLFVEKRQVNARAFLGYEKFFFSTVRAFDTRLGDPLDVDFGRLESCDEIFVNAKGNLVCVSGSTEKQFAVVDAVISELAFAEDDLTEHVDYGWYRPNDLGFQPEEIIKIFGR